MSFKAKNFLVSIVIMWPSFFIFIFSMIHIFRVHRSLSTPLLVFIYIFGSLLITLLWAGSVQLFSKDVKGQNAIMGELEKNGYTEHFLEVTSAEVYRLKEKNTSPSSRMYNIYLGYILNLANAYGYMDNTNAALETIALINPEDLKRKSQDKNPNFRMNLINYFNVQMNICEDIRDLERLDRVMYDASPYLEEFYGKNFQHDASINEAYTIYYLMHGDISTATQYANNSIGRSDKLNRYVGNLLMAKILKYQGRYNEAFSYTEVARNFATSPASKQFIEKLANEINALQNAHPYFG